MKLPLQVVFKNCPQSEAVVKAVEKKMVKLERFFPRIMGCRVVVEAPHLRQNKGNLYRVVVDLTLPGNEIVVGRNPKLHEAHQDVFVAIRDSFRAARRQLQDQVRRRRGEVRREKAGLVAGKVIRLFPEGYGFIEDRDGREIYFHENSVLEGKFERIHLGTEVRFTEESGDEGPQATTVHLLGKESRHAFW